MKQLDYNKLIPTGTFIDKYLQHMKKQETPVAYDFWCACWLLSLALGRGCIVPRPRAPVYMNLYLILVAESGTTRKSSAVRSATSITRQFINRLSEHDEFMDLIENKTTPEALAARLVSASDDHNYAHVAIAISELVTFFGREKYNLAMPGYLTDLYDSPSIRYGGGTLIRGHTEIKNVYVNFLSASTPAWLARAVNPDVIEGGFTSRTLFIVSDKRKAHIAWPEQGESDEAFETYCVDFLQKTRQRTKVIRELSLRGDAVEQFRRWYTRRSDSSDTFRSSFESREDSHVLRLAGLLAVNSDQWAIRPCDIETATKIITKVKNDGSQIFLGGTDAPLINGLTRLRDTLIQAGLNGITQSRLFLSCRTMLKTAEYKAALDIMHELGMVQRFEVPREEGLPGRPTTQWRATKLLAKDGAIEQVMEGI